MTQPAGTSNYSSDEIQSVVQQLTLSGITRTRDTLGVRRTDLTFDDVQQAAANVFILYPNSPYYVLQIGLKKINDLITSEAATLDSLISAVQATGRKVQPITDVGPLFSMQAALINLANAAANRVSALTNVKSTPAYQQLSVNSQAFLAGPAGQAVKSNGNIVQTPQQAVASIPGLLTKLKSQHAQLVAAVQGIANGIDNYNGIQLPNVVIESVLSKAADLVGSSASSMQPQTPTQRLGSARDTVLNVIAAKSMVDAFGSFSGPSDYYDVSGTGMPYSDSTHLANAAVLSSTSFNSYVITYNTTDQLMFYMDGSSTGTLVTLLPSYLATITGVSSDASFIISDGTLLDGSGNPIPENDKLLVNISNDVHSPYTVTLTKSPDYMTSVPADQIASDINSVVPTTVLASAVYVPVLFNGYLSIPDAGPGSATLTVCHSSPDPAAVNVVVGDTCQIVSSTHPGNIGIFTITAVDPGGVPSITVTVPLGATLTADSSAQAMMGAANRYVRLSANAASLVSAEASIGVADGPTDGSACVTLGLPSGTMVQCLKSTPDSVAKDINSKIGSLTASTSAVPVATCGGLSDTTNPLHIIFLKAEVLGTLAIDGSGHPVLTVTSITSAGAVSTGDTVALRSALTGYPTSLLIATINGSAATNHVLAVGDVVVGSNHNSSWIGLAAFPNMDGQFGPTLSPVKYQSVSVDEGLNTGSYAVTGSGTTAIDVIVQNPLPIFTSPTTPTSGAYSMSKISLNNKKLVFTSKNQTTQSKVLVGPPTATPSRSAVLTFFSTSPASAVGSSAYFQLPNTPGGMQGGDLLEFFSTSSFDTPAHTYPILQVFSSLSVVQIGPEQTLGTYPIDGVSWTFSLDQPPPFAAVHMGVSNDFVQVQAALDAWSALEVNQPLFLTNLNALINPLLINSNPTAAQVNNAVNAIESLYKYLTTSEATALGIDPSLTIDGIIPTYTVESVPAVDALIASYKQQGADAAVDTLLSGNFSGFFNLTSQTASYAGALQASIRSVARNDLPVRKFNRPEAFNSRFQMQIASPDLEYPANTVNENLQGEAVSPLGEYAEPMGYGANFNNPSLNPTRGNQT